MENPKIQKRVGKIKVFDVFDFTKHFNIMPRSWYSYNGTGDIFLANNYRLMSDKPGCAVGTVICAIFAHDGGRVPISPLSDSLQTYLSNARSTLVPQPQGAGLRKYVYLRPNF